MSQFLDLVKRRRSIRKYKEQAIDPEHLEKIMRAGLLAPASKHSNSWEFVIVENKEVLAQLSQVKAHGSGLLKGAAVAIAVVGNALATDVWIEDCCIAASYIQLQAEALGLGSCWVQIRLRYSEDGTPSEELVKEILNLPEGRQPQCIIGIGLKDETKKAHTDEEAAWERVTTI